MNGQISVLDLFSAAAGGWSLGFHRAGFKTVAACEWIGWRRAIYAQNNPGVPIYADWNGGLAGHLRLDDGLSPWVAQSRIAVGGPRGIAAASLIVEAFGDAVVPQIPEAIGRAILRVEVAMAAVIGQTVSAEGGSS